MAANYQMDPVIRRIDRSERSQAELEGIVLEIPRGDGWFAEKWYYRVAERRQRSGWTTVKTERDIDAPERNWRLPLQVALTLHFDGSRASKAEARQLVDSLRDAENPDRGMELMVNRWIDEFLADHKLEPIYFIDHFVDLRENLKAHLVRKAAQDAALKITHADLSIRGESEAREVLEIRIANMLVVLRDYKPELPLALDLDLRLAPASVLAFLPTGNREVVERELRNEIRELFRKDIGLQLWQFELQGEVKSLVSEAVAKVAMRSGREVARLMIAGKPPIDEVQTSFETHIEKEQFRQLNYPDPVEVDVAMRLDLVDLGALVNSEVNHRALDEWARQTVREAITHHLLNEPYVVLFDRFKDKNSETESAIKNAAAVIGYELTHIVLQTNLDFDVLQRGFECRIENATFPLMLRECEVVLDIETRLRISDREILRDLFNKNPGIRQTIEKTIRSTVSAELRNTPPEEFYLRFYGGANTTETSVADRLEDAIKRACGDEFKPDEDLTVHFAPRPDELMRVYQLLVQTPVNLTGVTDPNTKIVVDVGGTVNAISHDHWRRFQELKPEPDRVIERVREHVVSFINECTRANMKTFMSASAEAISGLAEKWVNERLAKDLGLRIAIVHWFRHNKFNPLGPWEGEVADLEASLKAISAQLRNAYTQGEPESVVEELKTRQQKVKEHLEKLYQERGDGSIMKAADPTFLIPGPSGRLLLSEAPRKTEE